MRLTELQDQLQAAILDPQLAERDPRLRIHHHHFWNRMRSFVKGRHPLLARFVGEIELADIVERYIVTHPPTTCVATKVSAALAGFLAATEPWCAQPILGELAAYDYRRSSAAINAEELALTRAELTADPALVVRLAKRTALAITYFNFLATPLASLRRDTPLDDHPTYLLVHMDGWRTRTMQLERRSWIAFETLVAGCTLRALNALLDKLSFTTAEIDGFIASCVEHQLLVAIDPQTREEFR